MYLAPTAAYERAKTLLQEKYGNPVLIDNLCMETLRQWPRILEGDGKSIREFLVFLIKCESVMSDQSFTNELKRKFPLAVTKHKITLGYAKKMARNCSHYVFQKLQKSGVL